MEAVSEHDLAQQLRQEGFYLTSAVRLKERKTNRYDWKSLFGLFGRVSLAEKMVFTRHLAAMIKAGLSLDRALRTLAAQSRNPGFRQILFEIEEDVRKGQTFSASLERYPDVFSDFFVNMIRVGETSGNLDNVLRGMASQMEKDYELRSRVRGAMIYPLIVVSLMVALGALMMVMVVPKLASVFEEVKVELPWTTKTIIAISKFLSSYSILALFLLILGVVLFRILLRTRAGKQIIAWIILNMPVFSGLSKEINSARFARNLSILTEAGIPIMLALQIVARTMTNYFFKESLMISAAQIQKGEPLNKILQNFGGLYPPLVIQMLEVGETTGSLSDILKELAEFYESEVNNATKNISSIIEPALMIIVGAAVGFFAISIIQPIYGIMSSI